MANNELMLDTLAAINTNPNMHDQAQWGAINPCGTTMCFAGWAVTLAGWKLKYVKDSYSDVLTAACCTKDGITLDIKDIAQIELGLTFDESQELFFSMGDATDIGKIVDKIVFGIKETGE